MFFFEPERLLLRWNRCSSMFSAAMNGVPNETFSKRA
jgi:hypothetical protein